MKSRCLNPNVPKFQQYGAKSVTVCERWLNSFAAFLEDIGEKPHGLTLDRINPYGNYEPENCRWATWSEQAKNKRLTHQLSPV